MIYIIVNNIILLGEVIVKYCFKYFSFLFLFVIFCFLNISSACALEENSTELLFEDNNDNVILNEENIGNNRMDTFLNSSDVIKYYKGSERYGANLYDCEGNILPNKTIGIVINGVENHRYFVDTISISIFYGASNTPNIIFNGSRLNFPSGIINRMSNIYYSNILDNQSMSIGYEGMRSFALATSKVTSEVLSYWLNKNNVYEPGLMKAAYGTFLTDLIIMYEHDCVADLAAETFNVSWFRSSPTAFSLCNDFNCLYVTGESDHAMGMCVNGSDNDVWKFHFTCSFAYSLIEQLVGSNIWQDNTIGSVTLGLLQSFMNNNSLELFYENGYYFLKVIDNNYCLLVLDPVTGIVRDIFSFNGLLGTMPCYHDGITENAIRYGNSLLNFSSSEFSQFNFLYFVSSYCSIIGSSIFEFVELGTIGSSIINHLALSAMGILFGFQIISPFLAEISRNNTLYFIADFYDLDLLGKIEAWIDYYFYQDGIIMDGKNEFNTNFYIENYEQIELNKKQTEDIIKNTQKIANKLFIPFQIVMASSSGGSKPDKSFYILSIITIYGVFSYYTFRLIETSIIAKQKYLFKTYDFNQPYSNKDSMIINQTVLGVN